MAKKQEPIEQFTGRIRSLENLIKDLRIEQVRLQQRNDALQSALVRANMDIRTLQKDSSEFLAYHRINEGLFLAD